MKNKTAPIGIFDSGIGGLTVAKAVMKVLPAEDIIYFGDTARVPYGIKSEKVVRSYALEITNFLLKKGVCKAERGPLRGIYGDKRLFERSCKAI